MENLVIYLLKATICLTAFSVFFRLLLMRETFFRFTRFTLISGLIVCSVLPFVKLKFEKSYAFQQTINQLEETLLPEKIAENENNPVLQSNEFAVADITSETAVSSTTPIERHEKPISWFSILVAVYWLGVAAMLLRFVGSFVSLNRLLRKSRKIDSGEYRLIISPENVVPFIFFRYIVLSEKDYRENPTEVILHEKMHIRKKHNIDVVFSELFLAAHWFNPMVWLMCRDLREIHEYEADSAVIDAGVEAQKYQLLLVKKAVGERRFTSVVNSFNQSKIKNRITMMLKTESSGWARLKVLFVVPLAVVALLAFAQPENVENQFRNYAERKNAMDYFLSVRKEQKEKYVAYFYVSENEHLFIMNEAIKDAVSVRAIDLKDKSDLSQIFTDLIAGKINETTSTPIDFILGAENDTEMKNVTIVKEAIREAYSKWCNNVSSERNIPLNVVNEEFPLSITYTSVQANDFGDIAKQVQSNPLFYWEQVQTFCEERGIEAKDLKKTLESGENRNVIPILLNSLNQGLIRNYSVKTPKEVNSESTIEALQSMIVNEWEKRKEGIVKKDEPLFFALQYDAVTHSDVVMQLLQSTLPKAYDAAVEEIAEIEKIDNREVRKILPLLLVNYTIKYTQAPPPPPPPSVVDVSKKQSEREKLIRDDRKIFSFHSVYGVSKTHQMAFNEVVDNSFPSNFKKVLTWRKKNSGIQQLNDVIVSAGFDISEDEIRTIGKTINEEFNVNKIIYCFRLPVNNFLE